MPHPRHLLQASGSHLSRLVKQAAALDRVTDAVRSLLPPALASHCRGAAWRDGDLTIFVDSPVWTTRLRFYQPDLKNGLKRQFQTDVRRIRIKVMPRRFATPAPRPEPQQQVTASTRRLLDATANAIDDPELADALRRLGSKNRG
ncbi:MAG TPA: DUF721 domain-containing protein [Gammaproteobacteria bacterium]|nr:DUF721 domain-containing protein [Gammaproteobacteria bacterium]